MNTPLRILIASAACAGALSAQSITLLNDTFTDAGRTDGTDAQDTAWYAAGTGTSLSVSVDGVSGSSALQYNIPGGFHRILGGMTSHDLLVGEAMTLRFDLRVISAAANVNNAFRFGVFNSQGTRQVDDFFGSSPTFNGRVGDAGYYATINGTTAIGGLGFFREVDTDGSPVAGPDVALINTANSTALGAAYNTLAFTITRTTATSIVGTFSYNGGSPLALGTSAGAPVTTLFDTVYFSVGSNTGGITNMFIDNVNVSVIPEPSTFAALAGLLALGGAILRRRKSP
jgi:hypothetical protein